MNRPLAVISFSGGLDSTVLLSHYLLSHKVVALSFNYGQRHVRELVAAKSVITHHRPVSILHTPLNLREVGNHLDASALTSVVVRVANPHY